MSKPFTVAYEDFKNELAVLINNSGLPASVIEPVLEKFLYELKILSQKQYQLDKAQYEKSLFKSQQDDEGDKVDKDIKINKE